MVEPLEIRVLGPLEVLVGGRPVAVSGSKRHALLALLALRRGRVVGVDSLVDALWGEDLPSSPRNAVQHHVARLRSALGPTSIAASPDGYALTDAAVDALRFEDLLGATRAALREGDAHTAADSVAPALALWRGPALQGLTDMAWFEAEARRLEALRVDALEEQFEAALALGEHREIGPALRAAIEESPFRERLWGQLMLALYRSGRQADALETFQEARRVLSEELGLEPGPELRWLQEAILAHEPAIAAVPVPPRRRGNLPTPTTSFVDREEDLSRVVALLGDHRLVTLTGPPGVGKSRLALEVAHSLESETEGIWLVDLALATDAADVVRLVADAVGAHGVDPLAGVVARMRHADTILVLDACEHSHAEAARVASIVLAECPGARVLATSREVLHVDGEVRVNVAPLPLGDPESEESADSPAVQLFAARARAARTDFEVTPEAARLIAEIARQVDGLPLAIELVAARVNALGLTELLSRVERRLELLQAPALTSDVARAALGTLVAWSYDLLHADEKTLLHQLAVHRGGASLASLVASGASHGLDESTVTYLLGTLVDKSIVSVSFPAGEARYHLLDTVRDYALEQLAESGGLAAARISHAEYFATLCDSARLGLRGPDWLTWIKRFELENDNLWAALAYAREAPDPGIALRLGLGSGWHFALAERVSEGRRFLELVLAAVSEDAALEPWFELVAFSCYFATEELDLDAAIEAGERALALAPTAAAPSSLGLVQVTLALAYEQAGDDERAVALADQGYAALEAAGDPWEIAAGSLLRAMVAARVADVSMVATMAAEAYRQADAIGFEAFQVPAAVLEAWVREQWNDLEGAVEAYQRALELAGRIGFSDHASFAIARLGANAFATGDRRHAEELERRALATAEGADSQWVAAHARVQLARILEADGDSDTAERLYRSVLEWSEAPRPHKSRESLFVVLADDPGTAALTGLADIAAARGETDTAGQLRARAGLSTAR